MHPNLKTVALAASCAIAFAVASMVGADDTNGIEMCRSANSEATGAMGKQRRKRLAWPAQNLEHPAEIYGVPQCDGSGEEG